MYNNVFAENRAVYEIMWKNMVEPDRPQMEIYIIRRMRLACWTTKTIYIWQQWLCERASVLLFAYIPPSLSNSPHLPHAFGLSSAHSLEIQLVFKDWNVQLLSCSRYQAV
jgi:hypothetical protein